MLNSKQRAYLGSFIGGLVHKETGMTSKDKRLYLPCGDETLQTVHKERMVWKP
jgi:hypothetical protein